MLRYFDLWQFIGGIGLFLFAMSQMELALKSFAGRSLKNFLRNHTNRPLKSVAVGTIMTALLQSSSLVGLLVLAFVGASIMSLENALGVIFGANLGTTLTGWLVTMLGFKLDLEGAALPLIGLGSLALVGFKGRISEVGRLRFPLFPHQVLSCLTLRGPFQPHNVKLTANLNRYFRQIILAYSGASIHDNTCQKHQSPDHG